MDQECLWPECRVIVDGFVGCEHSCPLSECIDSALWIERPRSSLPMTARAYATMIMVDLRRAQVNVPLVTPQGYTMQDALTSIVETAMMKAVEAHQETRWWRKAWRKIIGHEWP